jgi:hypothetical protein
LRDGVNLDKKGDFTPIVGVAAPDHPQYIRINITQQPVFCMSLQP